MNKKWKVNMLVLGKKGPELQILSIELGAKSEKQDVKEQLNRMGVIGEILSIEEERKLVKV
jgi:hypothetical protein